jgi:hypothetical protein
MHISRLARGLATPLLGLMMISASSARPGAQAQAPAHEHQNHDAPMIASTRVLTTLQNDLVKAVRAATARYSNVTDIGGPGQGYALMFGCVSGGDFGAMGMHYVNGSLLGDGDIDVTQPEIVLFEPVPGGTIRITGADFLVFAKDWDTKHKGEGPPSLNGQLFHYFEAPNRFGLDPFYTLHVWAWKDNPNGTFSNWNPDVSCDAYNPKLLSAPGER